MHRVQLERRQSRDEYRLWSSVVDRIRSQREGATAAVIAEYHVIDELGDSDEAEHVGLTLEETRVAGAPDVGVEIPTGQRARQRSLKHLLRSRQTSHRSSFECGQAAVGNGSPV